MGQSHGNPLTRLVYDGHVLKLEFYVTSTGAAPAEEWLEQLPVSRQ